MQIYNINGQMSSLYANKNYSNKSNNHKIHFGISKNKLVVNAKEEGILLPSLYSKKNLKKKLKRKKLNKPSIAELKWEKFKDDTKYVARETCFYLTFPFRLL